VSEQYKLIFTGQLAEGFTQSEVEAGLARLFKTEVAKIALMFSGQVVVLRKGLDEATAGQYLAALAKVGALAERVPMTPPPPVAAAPAAPALPAALAPPAPAIARAAATPPAAPDFSVAAVGSVLVESVATPAPAINIGHLTMAAAGVTLVDPEIVAAPFFDLENLSLAPVGVTLDETRAVSPPTFNLDGLTLAD
jgi:hypothetical protein